MEFRQSPHGSLRRPGGTRRGAPLTTRSSICLTAATLCLLSSCGSSTTQPDDTARLVVNGGDGQQGLPGQPLSKPLRVLVTKSGQPVGGVTIQWSVTAGGGAVNPTSSVTNQDGVASTIHTLGSALGTNRAEASSATASGRAVFTSEAVEEPVARAVLVAQVPIPPDYGIHDTHVRDGIAFVAAWNSGIWIYDV